MIKNICKDLKILSKISIEASKDDMSIGKDLMDTLLFYKETCVGMAANMIGINKRIIAIKDNDKYLLMYNPVIVRYYGDVYKVKEGCLCHLGQKETTRYQKIQVEYYDDNFKMKVKTFTGFTAEIIEHEVDHLNGILI